MDIKQLRFLEALAEEKHFGRAAAACFVTQPTLSARIRQLEDELGLPLIQRGNRFEGLTPEGERILGWARRVLVNYAGLYQEVATVKGTLAGQLRLGIVPSALPFSARLTMPFMRAHPAASIHSISRTADEITKSLESFALDLGIAYLDREVPDTLQTLELYPESYVLLVPEGEYFPDRDSVSWQEAASLPLCLLSKGMHNRHLIESAFQAAGCDVEPQFQSNSFLALYSHVSNGYWATIAPGFHARIAGLNQGVAAIPLVEPAVVHPVGLLWRQDEPLSPLVSAFIAQSRQHLVAETQPA
ncbi:MAG TPA: LysR family transcriptional regulator [Thiolinea sp.]|nr:LysR family transcriptional regulator [Thiolinea sp.]